MEKPIEEEETPDKAEPDIQGGSIDDLLEQKGTQAQNSVDDILIQDLEQPYGEHNMEPKILRTSESEIKDKLRTRKTLLN